MKPQSSSVHQIKNSRHWKALGWLGAIASLPPSGYMTLIFLLAIRAWIHTGAWPQYGQPDPKELSLPVHYDAAVIALVLTMTVSPILLVAYTALTFWFSWAARRIYWRMGIPWLIYLSVRLYLILDPFDLEAWLAD